MTPIIAYFLGMEVMGLAPLLLELNNKYDVLLIPVQKIPIKSKNVIYSPMQRQRYSKRFKKDDADRIDFDSYEDRGTDVANRDSSEYGNNRDGERVGEFRAYDFESNYGDDKIVGGFEVEINLYPYHVGYGSNCGGAIIDKRWVLTAGHCGKKSYIRAGSKYINQGKKINVKKGYVHPMWTAKKKEHPFDYDFQLLELSEPLKFEENIQPIKIAHIEDMVIGKVITVTGWGNTEENGPYSNVLRAVRVPIISKERCQNVPFPYFRGSLTARMFCAGYAEGKKDACQGDSGGPAVAYDRLLGMVSFGYGCATPGSYGVYSKVAKVRTWIEQTTGITFD
ncbi:trypsin 5G1-like isoform X2 [Spodoptera frugiperda]|uniref:Vitamin K-dependent protein C n=1 Tax=Spodoptera frugiperda TaxID=7108 RepID=A0A9R0DL72_SPOFR|nr:trypsin 5G1-like isoform X2 [Spodoptera frugiperda]